MENAKQFIPFYFEREPVFQHKDCGNFDPETGKCKRRNVLVIRTEISCQDRAVTSRYNKFKCLACGQNEKFEKLGIKTYETETHIIQVGFFKCKTCGKITAVFQLNGQRLIPVEPEIEDVFDPNWLTLKIAMDV
ncbi:hypothetical protein [Bacteroides sp.]|uniref:hypothetical protein n=1 Tax=Bacteroides sp. TaxID=29523 RepID=UPI0026241328|nr:hypothetical protein [Bacteroides sp.]MDD3040570.1 hypothetical protein [Bacteroides sp.]